MRGFTRDPAQLQGSMLRAALRKSPQGFGFTIIGGDRPDEFLQVKNVLRDGPAAHDNKMASGEFLLTHGHCTHTRTDTAYTHTHTHTNKTHTHTHTINTHTHTHTHTTTESSHTNTLAV